MAKRGRPTAYRPEFPDLARKFCLLGATNDDLARVFEVAESTINKWLAGIPEFSGAVKEGREVADAKVAESLYHRAIGYSHSAVKIFMPAGADEPVYAPYTEHYPPDTAAAFIWLKNRRKADWRDKAEVEVTHRHDASNLTDEELAEIVASRRRGGTSETQSHPEKLH
ncbi:MAG: helix-turn-helix domain-containing protein [Proteobacteria bacterium]|nr:helix-turn-helix domain-containing protein [Pseudomonadota bacterium]